MEKGEQNEARRRRWIGRVARLELRRHSEIVVKKQYTQKTIRDQ
jgi:hypothetical protein